MTTESNPTLQSCPDCHALTDDLAAHERWHTRLVADLAHAVAQEMRRAAAH